MSNIVRFTKMHGLGNDFVVIHQIAPHALDVRALADRHTGIGFDQLLLIEPSTKADFFCRIFNQDGSEAMQCGNGLRCVARYLHEQKLHAHKTMTIETRAGIFPITIHDYDNISVTLGIPVIENKHFALPVRSGSQSLCLINTGNPHAILSVSDIQSDIVLPLAEEIKNAAQFSGGINIGFLQILTPSHGKLRTIERGAGETLACGSNACAAAVAGMAQQWFKSPRVQIEFSRGSLLIDWEGEGAPVIMQGPASRLFDGTF